MTDMDVNALTNKLAEYEWWQTIPIEDGKTFTPGNPVIRPINDKVLEELKRLRIAGKRVLEVGCRDGLFCFESERLGAREVIGIDHILSRGATELLIPAFKSKVRMVELNLFDLKPETLGRFDL